MLTVTLHEAQARLPDLIRQLLPGEEVMIVENGQSIARLTAHSVASGDRPSPGLGRELLSIAADDEAHLRDFSEYMP